MKATSLACLLILSIASTARADAETSPPEDADGGVRFGLFGGGLVVPGANVNAVAGGAMLNLATKRRGLEPRLYAMAYHVEDDHTGTTGGAALFHDTFWFGVYGLGFGGGLGYASFTKKSGGGWDDSSAQVIAYVSPVMLQFGQKPAFEVGLNAGATRFFAHDLRPFGYAYAGVLF
jgi:hypothetical protein